MALAMLAAILGGLLVTFHDSYVDLMAALIITLIIAVGIGVATASGLTGLVSASPLAHWTRHLIVVVGGFGAAGALLAAINADRRIGAATVCLASYWLSRYGRPRGRRSWRYVAFGVAIAAVVMVAVVNATVS